MPVLEAPQLVTNSRMLYFTWIPADPDAVRALVPSSLQLAENNQCFINQYVVDTADQTSGFEAYSLTYAGADLSGHDTPDGAVPGGGGPTTSTPTPTCVPTPPSAACRRSQGRRSSRSPTAS